MNSLLNGVIVATFTVFFSGLGASAQTKDSARVTKETEFVLEVPLLSGAENLVPLDLPLVAEEAVPAVGTFWSASRYELEPPLPFNRFPNLPVYALGNGQMLLDDRAVDFNLWLQQLTTWQVLSRAARGEALAEPPLALRVVQNYNGVDLLPDLEDITNAVATFSLYCPRMTWATTCSAPPICPWRRRRAH